MDYFLLGGPKAALREGRSPIQISSLIAGSVFKVTKEFHQRIIFFYITSAELRDSRVANWRKLLRRRAEKRKANLNRGASLIGGHFLAERKRP